MEKQIMSLSWKKVVQHFKGSPSSLSLISVSEITREGNAVLDPPYFQGVNLEMSPAERDALERVTSLSESCLEICLYAESMTPIATCGKPYIHQATHTFI